MTNVKCEYCLNDYRKNSLKQHLTRCKSKIEYDNLNINRINIRNSAVKKLISNICENCGKTSDTVTIVLHHKNPIKNINKSKPIWKLAEQCRQRKTIAVCHECHMKIHHG